MALVIGEAGGYARRHAVAGILGVPLATALFAGLAVSVMKLNSMTTKMPTAFLLTTVVLELAFFLWKDRSSYLEMLDDFRTSGSWFKGAEGERRVGNCLSRLSDEYVVFNDFTPRDAQGNFRPWNVDHIVIGPTGVFVIETKNYTSTRVEPVQTSPRTADDVAQASKNAMDLKKKLELWSGGRLSNVFVEAVLVFAQDHAHVENLREGTTNVLPLRLLLRNILHRGKGDVSQFEAYRVARVIAQELSSRRRRHYAERIQELDAAYSREFETASPARKTVSAETDPPSACPNCGAPLVRRVAKRGQRRGKPFLGCSRWGETHCNYIFNLDEASTHGDRATA